MSRVIGNNSHGNRNEEDLVLSFNGKKYKELNLNLKKFVKYICEDSGITLNDDLVVLAEYETKTKLKQDLYLIIDGKKFGVSLKMGSGNSVHQEKCEDFIKYIKNALKADTQIQNYWRLFIWADGTLNGVGSLNKDAEGKIISRFTSTEFRSKYPNAKLQMQNFLIKNEPALIEHFLFVGRHGSKVDYIYHGTPQSGVWVSKKEIIDYQLKESSNKITNRSAALMVGKMTLQSWNISKKGTSEKKRGQLQVKYGGVSGDIDYLVRQRTSNYGTFEGDRGEFDLVKLLNKEKNHRLWKKLIPGQNDFSKYYLVRVTQKAFSSMSGRRVNAKSDAFIINSTIDKDFLLEREYVLTEKDLLKIEYYTLPLSGISIKLKSSRNYTIQKFTKESFCKVFGTIVRNVDYVFYSLLLYSDPNQIHKNHIIARELKIDIDKFSEFAKEKISKQFSIEDQLCIDEIRKYSQDLVKKIIESNIKLKESIFYGKHWFADPYFACFLYSNGDITSNYAGNFSITTGSGRTKGIYAIEIKPQ